MNPEDRHDEGLNALYWRDEILQLMYWLRGEGFAKEVAVSDLLPLLDGEENTIAEQLENLRKLGDIEFAESGQRKYRFTPTGLAEAEKRFYDEFEPHLARDAHGECAPDCECHDEASRSACEAERRSDL